MFFILYLLFTLTIPVTLIFVVILTFSTMGIIFLVKQWTQRNPLGVRYNTRGSIDNKIPAPGHAYMTSVTCTNRSDAAESSDFSINPTTLPEQSLQRITSILKYKQPVRSDPYYTEVTSAVANALLWLDKAGLLVNDVDPDVPPCTFRQNLTLPRSPSDTKPMIDIDHCAISNATGAIPFTERPAIGLGLINMNPNTQVTVPANHNNTNKMDDGGSDYFPDPEGD